MTDPVLDEPVALLDVVEIDRMTGNEKTMWQHVKLSEEEADKVITWLEKHIVPRYGYRKVPTGTGPEVR